MERRTILFVDQVGSTRQLTEIGDEAMVAVRNRLWALINAAVDAHGGRVFSEEGDGGAIAFESVDSGTAASLEILQAAAESNFEIRVGIHDGNVVPNGSGFVGLTVHLAARLCDVAPSGHVVATAALSTRLAAGTARVTDFGQRALRGFTDPIPVVLLSAHDHEPPMLDTVNAAARPRLQSSPLLARSMRPMVGRSSEMTAVLEGVASKSSGQARLVMIGGDPGAGKSTLAYEACRVLVENGAVCLIGRADEGSLDPSHELLEMLGPLVAQAPLALLADHVVRHGDLLTRLLPGLGDRVPSAARPVGETARQPDQRRLFEAVADLVRAQSSSQPLVLLFEDAHWGTGPSLGLFRHLLRAPDLEFVTLLVTYRTTDVAPGSEFSSFLRRVIVEPKTDVLLSPLDGQAIRTLAAAQFPELAADAPEALGAFAERVRQHAGGNALMCVELLAALANDSNSADTFADRDLPLPASVQEITYRRVDRLGAEAASVLTDASVLGEHFSLAELQQVTGDGVDALDALDRGERAGLVRPATDTGHQFSFTHAVAQRALYARMRTAERLRRHRKVVDALAAMPHARAADVLNHLQRAGALATLTEIVRFASAAAADASERLALNEAMTYRQIAVDALEHADENGESSSPTERAHALLALGRAETAVGLTSGKASMVAAAQAAKQAGDWQLVGEIATQYGGDLKENQASVTLSEPIELISEALDHHTEATPMRARLLTSLALWQRQSVPYAQRRRLVDEAIEIARSSGDRHALVAVLSEAHRALHGPNVAHEGFRHADELVQLAAELGDDGALFQGLNLRLLVAAELGDADAVRVTAQQLEEVGARLRHIEGRRITLMSRTLDASVRGDFATEQKLAAEIHDLLVDYPPGDLGRFEFALKLGSMWLRGNAKLLYDLVNAISPRQPTLAWLAADSDQLEAIEGHLAASGGFEGVHRQLDYMWWHDVVAFTRAARGMNDIALARRIRAAALPYRSHNAMMGLIAFLGSAEHHLGTLAAVCGDHDDAVAHFEAALVRHSEMGAIAFLALTRAELAGVLLARAQVGDAHRASALIDEATATADELQLGLVHSELDRL